jgi:transcription elongation factor GreB
VPRFMTREGHEAIVAEIDHLWRVERPAITESVYEAAQLGDRSENAEYIYGKRRIREIDGRLAYLRKKIEGVQVVALGDIRPSEVVQFGALVEVEDEEGQRHRWRLVDKDESDPKQGRISVQSPVGRALLGRRAGDAFTLSLPKGDVDYEVLSVRYGADPAG